MRRIVPVYATAAALALSATAAGPALARARAVEPVRLTGIQLEHHDTYDRLVLDFSAPPASPVLYAGTTRPTGCATGADPALPGERFVELRLSGVVGHDAAGARTFPQEPYLLDSGPGVTGYAVTCDNGERMNVEVGVRGGSVRVTTTRSSSPPRVVVTIGH